MASITARRQDTRPDWSLALVIYSSFVLRAYRPTVSLRPHPTQQQQQQLLLRSSRVNTRADLRFYNRSKRSAERDGVWGKSVYLLNQNGELYAFPVIFIDTVLF